MTTGRGKLRAILPTTLILMAAHMVKAGEPASNAPRELKPLVLLGEAQPWRTHFTMGTPVIRKGSGLVPASTNKWPHTYVCASSPPAGDWTEPGFDDSEWPRWQPSGGTRGEGGAFRFGFEDAGAPGPALAALRLRGRFLVADPAQAGGLKLSLTYRGGVVVCLNGRELIRSHLSPAGPLTADSVAEDYPPEVFLKENKKPIQADFGEPGKYREILEKRLRKMEGVAIDPRWLRAGVNVLTIEIRRAPYFGPGLDMEGLNYRSTWGTCGLAGIRLEGTPASGNTAPEGLTVCNHPAGQWVGTKQPLDIHEPIRALRLAGARNGSFSGQVLVGSRSPLDGIRVTAVELKTADGRARIPASAMQVRFAAPALFGHVFDGLDDSPPDTAGKLQPVWITVRVPRDAAPGSYHGRFSVAAGGGKPVEVPVILSVADFLLPDSRDFRGFLDVVDSPRTVALKFNVPIWSPEHWKLLDRNFELMGQVGAKAIYLTILPDTYFGNGEGLLRWKKEGGGWVPDFGPVDRYLNMAVQHLGKVPVVCAYLWDRRCGVVNYTTGPDGREFDKAQDRGVPITVLDPATGLAAVGEGPKWGTPEAREFWRPVIEGLRERLTRRDMGKSLMWGLATDRRPRKETVEDLRALAPEIPWVCHTHPRTEKIHNQPVGYLVHVWGSPLLNSPAIGKRLRGWQNPLTICNFPRLGSGGVGWIYTGTSPLKYRAGIEGMVIAGYRGLGRIGGNFWPVLKSDRGEWSDVLRTSSDVGETWGIGFDASVKYLLAPGRSGPVGTVRHEMFRENLQEIEARIVLETALSDPANRGRLGETLAARCQGLLDERGRAIVAGNASPDWLAYAQGMTDRTEKLYAAAAEVAGKLSRR